jgi:ABC-type proline/glycine betaine transport system substrate-binding protein
MKKFIADTGITFANINDGDGDVFARFNVPYQPAWVFVARDGTATTTIGVLSEPELERALSRLANS